MADGPVRTLLPAEASALLNLPVEAVEALIRSRYLEPVEAEEEGPRLSVSDLKAFLARNADNGGGNVASDSDELLNDPSALFPTGMRERIDLEDLIDALDDRAEEMARRVFDIFASMFREAESWSAEERSRFMAQARGRLSAILAVTSQGSDVDTALIGDLLKVGANAAMARSPLPQLLVILRISRDLIVQTALEIAENLGRQAGLALSLLISRVLPVMDTLVDSISEGFWTTLISQSDEELARYRYVIEHSGEGIYEVDLDGRLNYANRALGNIAGFEGFALEGKELTDILRLEGSEGSVSSLFAENSEQKTRTLVILRPDGTKRVVEVQSMARRSGGSIIGFCGIVNDRTEHQSPGSIG